MTKASKFISLLREVISSEVRKAVKQELAPIKKALLEQAAATPPPLAKPKLKPNRPAPKREVPLVQFDGPLKSLLEATAAEMAANPIDDDLEEDQPLGSPSVMTEDAFVRDYSKVLESSYRRGS